MREQTLGVIDELHRLAHEHPDLPVLVRNVQGYENEDLEENKFAPFWTGTIVGANVGRFYVDAYSECILMDNGNPDMEDILCGLRAVLDGEEYHKQTTILTGQNKTEAELEREIREYYESFEWHPAIIADIGISSVG